MWAVRRTKLGQHSSEQVVVTRDHQPLTFADVIAGWRDDEEFRAFFIAELAATALPAFFWEMPPIRQGQTDITYEYVTIRSDALARLRPDPRAFESEFRNAPRPVATFRNLGGDALLVAPKPIAGAESYGHLAAFLRSGPVQQRHELFRTLGSALASVLGSCHGRLWTSTSGLGVPWLHVRLDSFPKYYQHRPYADG